MADTASFTKYIILIYCLDCVGRGGVGPFFWINFFLNPLANNSKYNKTESSYRYFLGIVVELTAEDIAAKALMRRDVLLKKLKNTAYTATPARDRKTISTFNERKSDKIECIVMCN